MTETASQTKTPPMMKRSNSFLRSTASVPKAAPVEREPVSPINTSAGEELNQRYPMQAPAMAAVKMVSSPAPGK